MKINKKPKYEFKVGDRVQFKTWEEMESEFGNAKPNYYIDLPNYNQIEFVFDEKMKTLCDTYATIKRIYSYGEVELKNFTTSDNKAIWSRFSLDMLKPPTDASKYPFTEDEKVILRNVPEKYKWIARDKNGCLYIYEKKPEKSSFIWEIDSIFNDNKWIEIFDHLFQCIKWEDDEPCEFRKYI